MSGIDDLSLLLHCLDRARAGALRGRDAAEALHGEAGARLWNEILGDVRLAQAIAERIEQ